jgi:NAD(P)-dependent dehydrogenase (short-subunit alcohol dehydrogenase family)
MLSCDLIYRTDSATLFFNFSMVFKYEIQGNFTGKVAIVTGGSSGIGRVTALKLAGVGFHVIIAGRSKTKTMPIIENIKRETGNEKVDFLQLCLDDLTSVRIAAIEFLQMNLPLHLLINNAGIAGDRGLSKDGFEITFATNHLGHFLFTHLLLGKLKESAPSRIINVSSKAHYNGKAYDWERIREPANILNTLHAYEQSKLANVMFTKKLRDLLKDTGVTVYSLHPGVVATDVWRQIPWPIASLMKFGMISEEDGALTTLFCATDQTLNGQSGLYYDDCRLKDSNPLADDANLCQELWDKSLEFCKGFL